MTSILPPPLERTDPPPASPPLSYCIMCRRCAACRCSTASAETRAARVRLHAPAHCTFRSRADSGASIAAASCMWYSWTCKGKTKDTPRITTRGEMRRPAIHRRSRIARQQPACPCPEREAMRCAARVSGGTRTCRVVEAFEFREDGRLLLGVAALQVGDLRLCVGERARAGRGDARCERVKRQC